MNVVPEKVLIAIRDHEVDYQFTKPNIRTYEDHLGPLTPDCRNFMLVALYIDIMSSIRQSGKPDLHNFFALIVSKHNAEIYEQVLNDDRIITGAANGTLNKQKVDAFLRSIHESDQFLPQPDALVDRIMQECLPTP